MNHGIQAVFAKNIRRLRKNQKLTQHQLSELVEVSPSFIGLIETGKSNVSFGIIEMLAKALNVSPSVLFIDEAHDEESCVAEKTPNYSTIGVRLFSEIQHLLAKYKEEIYPKK
ncbi:MAG: helix-turn-helix domain-containing protein [Treponemataceae bacterium]